MTNQAVTEIDLWSRVTDMLGDGGKRLGPRWSGQLHRDPIALALTLAWAKFAAKMACAGRSVLELGCDEGIRSPILSEHADGYVGLDTDETAIAAAEANWNSPRRSFVAGPWLGQPRLGQSLRAFQTVVCHDVRSLGRGASYDLLLETVLANLDGDGLCVLGLSLVAPGTFDDASAEDIRRLTDACSRAFRRVLCFGMNDGLVHTRCTPAAEHVILLGVCPQAKELDGVNRHVSTTSKAPLPTTQAPTLQAGPAARPTRSPAITAPAAAPPVILGRYVGYWFDRTPRRALYCTSYYKFAARLIGRDRRVLDVGCSEGLGTWLLATECGSARGIDSDEAAVRVARENWRDPRIEFECGDFLAAAPGEYDAVVNFDVIEHIFPQHAEDFLARLADNLVANGMAVVGTPSLEGQTHASDVSKAGHVNVYSGERLEAAMRRHFRHVFMFAANDEMVHTGFLPMAHYLIAVGCIKRDTLKHTA